MGPESLERVYDRIDDLQKTTNKQHQDLLLAIGKIHTQIARMEALIPSQPCTNYKELRKDFEEHLNEHKESKKLRWQVILKIIGGAGAFTALGAALREILSQAQ